MIHFKYDTLFGLVGWKFPNRIVRPKANNALPKDDVINDTKIVHKKHRVQHRSTKNPNYGEDRD